MTTFHESIKQILNEVEKFLVETIKSQKLSKSGNEHKQTIIDKILKLREEYPQLAPPKPIGKDDTKLKQGDSVSSISDLDRGHSDESARTGGSSNADDNEDYADSTIPLIPASELSDPVVESFLEKKQRKAARTLFGGPKLQKRWCVISHNILYYYESQKDKKQHGAFHLSGYTFEPYPDAVDKKDSSKRDLAFQLICPAKRTYQFVAFSKDEFDKWKAAVERSAAFVKDDSGEMANGLIQDDVYEDCDAPALPPSPEPIQEDIYDDTANVEETLEQDDVYDDCGNTAEAPLPPPPPLRTPVPPTPIRREVPPIPPSPSPSESNAPPVPPGRHGQPLPAIPTTPEPETKKQKLLPREQDFENLFFGRWDCSADADNELGFKKGDKIHIISRKFDDKDWWVGELDGKFGLVPKPYLTPAYEEARSK